MGILDDLAMGFGLKERTEDYDARTARTIASNEAERAARASGAGDHAAMMAGIRARQNYNSSAPMGQSAYYLNRAGGANYRPQIAEDNRPLMQRMLFSQEGAASPRRYAIGPLTMDQPLPSFGIFGLLSSLSNFNKQNVPTVSADKSPMRVRPGYTGGQKETTFTENFDNVEMAEFGDPIVDAATAAIDAGVNPTLLSTPNVYDPNGDFGLRPAPESLLDTPSLDPDLTLITSGPHAGKYVDRNGRLRMP